MRHCRFNVTTLRCQQVDPMLERTVLVCTKLDTKLPQFSTGEDLEEFVEAPLMKTMYSAMLGG
jgi:hypothetical protein